MTELSGFNIYLDVDANGNRFYTGDLKNYVLYVMSIDNFFVSCWGAITSICRELWNAYGLKLDVRKVKLTRFLQSVNDKEWFQYLNGARTRVEHGQILMIEIRGDTGGMVIADNQNVEIDKITTNKKYEPVYWCKVIFNETCRFVDTCSKYMSEVIYKP